jgi:predicted transcriptional regulator
MLERRTMTLKEVLHKDKYQEIILFINEKTKLKFSDLNKHLVKNKKIISSNKNLVEYLKKLMRYDIIYKNGKHYNLSEKGRDCFSYIEQLNPILADIDDLEHQFKHLF